MPTGELSGKVTAAEVRPKFGVLSLSSSTCITTFRQALNQLTPNVHFTDYLSKGRERASSWISCHVPGFHCQDVVANPFSIQCCIRPDHTSHWIDLKLLRWSNLQEIANRSATSFRLRCIDLVIIMSTSTYFPASYIHTQLT